MQANVFPKAMVQVLPGPFALLGPSCNISIDGDDDATISIGNYLFEFNRGRLYHR